jgi:hypothetical protein
LAAHPSPPRVYLGTWRTIAGRLRVLAAVSRPAPWDCPHVVEKCCTG